VRGAEFGGLLGELADGWPSPVGGEVTDKLGQVADAAGGVDLPGQGLHRPGRQGDGVVDLGLVLTQACGCCPLSNDSPPASRINSPAVACNRHPTLSV